MAKPDSEVSNEIPSEEMKFPLKTPTVSTEEPHAPPEPQLPSRDAQKLAAGIQADAEEVKSIIGEIDALISNITKQGGTSRASLHDSLLSTLKLLKRLAELF